MCNRFGYSLSSKNPSQATTKNPTCCCWFCLSCRVTYFYYITLNKGIDWTSDPYRSKYFPNNRAFFPPGFDEFLQSLSSVDTSSSNTHFCLSLFDWYYPRKKTWI